MEIKISTKSIDSFKGQGLLIGLFAGERLSDRSLPSLSQTMPVEFSNALKEEGFSGNTGDNLTLHTHGEFPFRHLIIVGLGKKAEYNTCAARTAIGAGIRQAQKLHIKDLAINFSNLAPVKSNTADIVQAITEGAKLGAYRFVQYKKEKDNYPHKITLINVPRAQKVAAEEAITSGKVFAEATNFARNLINEPASHITPDKLADIAQELAKENAIKVTVADTDEIVRLSMGAYLAVARGSDNPPRLIRLSYEPSGAKRHISLIGKAITFDSGGLSLKPRDAMETMKTDMTGGAIVLAVFRALAKLKPKIKVTAIIPAAENMPSGHAMRPGDIAIAANGKSIEIANTDAEGRLTLADALVIANQEKPDVIIDLATLTGAAIVALGQGYSAILSNNDRLSKSLIDAGKKTGEDLWPLPLPNEYKYMLDSDIADFRNIGPSRWGDVIAGALFLQEFVDDTPWAHIDLSSAWQDRETPLSRKGVTGYGARLILEYLLDSSNQ